MSKILWTIFGCWLCGLLAAAGAVTVPLADGTTVGGDIVSFNDNGIIFRTGDDKYTDRLPWLKFSQDGLKQLAQNPKIEPFAAPFIAPPPRPPKPGVEIGAVPRLQPPATQSFFGALFSSPVGLISLLLIYAANIYAGYEIARYRAKPVGLVTGVSAALPIVGPVIFLSMIPPPVEAAPEEETLSAAEQPEPHRFALPGQAPPGDIHIVAASWAPGKEAPRPEAQVFQRGQFMFNRRFFETRFPGFFGSMRGEEDRGKTLIVKTAQGEFIVERILRVGNNEANFEAEFDGVRQEAIVPFADIQEVRLKPKEA